MADLATMALTEISKLPGVGDLPLKVRSKFVSALKTEAKGDHATAAKRLSEAITAERELATKSS